MAFPGLDFNAFPRLVFDSRSGDMSHCFKKWLTRFNLAVEMMTVKLGTEAVTGSGQQPKFRGRIKVLALLQSIGDDGLEALNSVGFDYSDDAADFAAAVTALRGVFERAESDYIKTNKFVSAKQMSSEDEVEFYHRVEKLSRALNFGENNDIRKQIALSIAVCGLRDADLRRSLMSEENMTWDSFCTKCKNKVTAKESEEYLFGNGANSSYHNMGKFDKKLNIKQEVDLVDSGKKIEDSKYAKYRHPNSNEYSSSSSESVDSYDESMVGRVSSNGKSKSWRRDRSSSYSSSNEFVPGYKKKDFSHKNYKTRESRASRYEDSGRCIGCRKKGHFLRECPFVRCYNCQKKGHTSMDCKSKNRSYKSRRNSPHPNRDDSSSERKVSVRFASSNTGG